jgi:hypothetical protein
MKLVLHRFQQNEKGTFGLLTRNDDALCLTCEDPWRDNKKSISCIPPGQYAVTKHNGTKYKNVWRLLDVPGREAILIHQGNTQEHTKGCILVGDSLGMVGGNPAVLNSLSTLNYLRSILPDNFTLYVKQLSVPLVRTAKA